MRTELGGFCMAALLLMGCNEQTPQDFKCPRTKAEVASLIGGDSADLYEPNNDYPGVWAYVSRTDRALNNPSIGELTIYPYVMEQRDGRVFTPTIKEFHALYECVDVPSQQESYRQSFEAIQKPLKTLPEK